MLLSAAWYVAAFSRQERLKPLSFGDEPVREEITVSQITDDMRQVHRERLKALNDELARKREAYRNGQKIRS